MGASTAAGHGAGVDPRRLRPDYDHRPIYRFQGTSSLVSIKRKRALLRLYSFLSACTVTVAAHVPQVIFEWWWITSRGRTSFYLRIPAELRPRSYLECDAPAEAEEPGVLGLAFAGLNGPRMHDSDSRDILGNSLRGRVSGRLTRWNAASRLSGNWATAGA